MLQAGRAAVLYSELKTRYEEEQGRRELSGVLELLQVSARPVLSGRLSSAIALVNRVLLFGMLKLTCHLNHKDGRSVAAEIEARWPGVEYFISYSGAVELLPSHLVRGTPADLELAFRMASYRTGASLQVDRLGEYESKANRPRL